jgi:hypothetical protein
MLSQNTIVCYPLFVVKCSDLISKIIPKVSPDTTRTREQLFLIIFNIKCIHNEKQRKNKKESEK